MLRTLSTAVVLLGIAALPAVASTSPGSAASSTKALTKPAADAAKTAAGATKAAAPGGGEAVVLQTVLGDIVVKLYDKDAPKTSANFRKLARDHFYDGTSFHRVIAGFMIQGGDPNTKDGDPSNDGMGGPSYTVPAEIKRPHLRGSLATARQGDQVNPERASSGSQFFIDLAPQPGLDQGGYTVFGEVISGMDVVDKIAAFAQDASLPQANGGGRNPGKKALIQKAYLAPLSKFEKGGTAAK